MVGYFARLVRGPGWLGGRAFLSSVLALALGCSPRLNATEDDLDSAIHFSLPWETDETPAVYAREREDSTRQMLEAEYERCGDAIDDSYADASRPTAKTLEARRAQVLMRAKSEPVFFVREPQFDEVQSPGVAAHQKRLMGKSAREASLQLLRQFKGHKEITRQLFLREGYFFVDDPWLAREVAVRLSLEDLFDAPRIHIQRGAFERTAARGSDGRYYHDSGEDRGQRAQLLLFDRVFEEGAMVGPPLHIDVREALARGAIDQLRVIRVTERQLLGEARYDDVWAKVLFDLNGSEARIHCVLVRPEDQPKTQAAKDRAFRRASVVRQLRRQIVAQVAAGLPFDEPRTERGQQDGELRRRWEEAYLAGKLHYTMNGDKYDVFDRQGHPLTPQVCVDFVTETLERAGGMHYADRGAPPEKIHGTLDFDLLLEGQRRRESALRNFARANPHRLELLDYAIDDAIPYERTSEFFRWLEQHQTDFEVGDAVIIRGRAAWDHYSAIHSHAFFIYETDPITGVPILLAGNSGKPRIVTWDAEMTRAPKRRVLHRIRPNMTWLYDHVVLHHAPADERWAPPLTVFSEKDERL